MVSTEMMALNARADAVQFWPEMYFYDRFCEKYGIKDEDRSPTFPICETWKVDETNENSSYPKSFVDYLKH